MLLCNVSRCSYKLITVLFLKHSLPAHQESSCFLIKTLFTAIILFSNISTMSHLRISKGFRCVSFLANLSLLFIHFHTLPSSPHRLEKDICNQLSSYYVLPPAPLLCTQMLPTSSRGFSGEDFSESSCFGSLLL